MKQVNYLWVIYSDQGICCSDHCIFHGAGKIFELIRTLPISLMEAVIE